ncbi:MAG: tetratricopeptide repeat protein [Alphaproteobacteria bacterium]|nr:tetratricopeptide repeat protein [Alphaproteobacteria bacterium]
MFTRYFTCLVLILALTLPLVAGGTSARADQTDARLSTLFGLLRSAPSYPAAFPVEQQIWTIWIEGQDEEANVAMRLGIDAMNRRDFTSAVVFFGNAARIDPEFSEAFNKRATAYYLMGRYQESVVDIQRTLELEPRHFGALAGLGLIYQRLDEPEAALKAVERSLEIHPTQPGMNQTRDILRQILEERKT